MVSLAIFAYKQEDFIEEAIESAFAQDYENLEIIISDDNSPDQTFTLIKAKADAYKGPHQVRINQNQPNLGIANHHNKVVDMARGELVVLIAGDDISHPQRVREVAEAWQQNGQPFMLVSKFECIDANSKPLPLEDHIHFNFPPEKLTPTQTNVWNFLTMRSGLKVYGSTESVSKEMWRYYGPIGSELRAEDIVYFFRALLLGKFHFIDETHVAYRMAHKIEQVQLPDPVKTFGRPVNAEYARQVNLFKMLQPALEQCQKDLALHMAKTPSAQSQWAPIGRQLKQLLKVRQIWISWYQRNAWQKLTGLLFILGTLNKRYILWTQRHILGG